MKRTTSMLASGRPIRDRIAAYYYDRVFQYKTPLTSVPHWIMADPHYGLHIAARALRSVLVDSEPYHAALKDLLHISNLMQATARSDREYYQALRLQSYYDFCFEKIKLKEKWR